MDTQRICPNCKKPLANDVPMGLCPECLVKAGFPSGLESETGATGPRFVPPSIAELAKSFPQLEILAAIGQGGMGAVYKVRQPKLNRIAALKILPPTIGNRPAFAERFTREAQALAQLNHPGIVTLYEFGESNGQFYFLMEFVDGVNLRQLLQAERVSAREALAIVPQICDALQFAHDQGVVHRDIKPENILLDRRGRVKVADFGLAKLVGTEGECSDGQGTSVSSALTETGKVMGTPQYMPPEQREHPAEVDHRADIYALGVVFYQMLTGELPGKPIVPPSRACGKVHVDVRLDEIVLRALQQKPELRYQQASVLRTEVETVATSLSAAAEPHTSNQSVKAAHTFKLTAAIGSMWFLVGLGLLLLGNFGDVSDRWWGYWLLGLCLLPTGAYLMERHFRGSYNNMPAPLPASTAVNCPLSMDGWLALIDTGEYERSWEVAAPYLQRSTPKADWVARLEKLRRPWGEVLARKPVSITQTVAGTRYEGIHESSFQNLTAATEIVTYAKQPGGEWQPIGYEIKPRQARSRVKRALKIVAVVLLSGMAIFLGLSFLIYMFARADGEAKRQPEPSATSRPPVPNDKIIVEDLALQMIVAIREKGDAKLRTLASDKIKGWPESLPQFAVELRERYRQSTGNEAFDMRAGESLVDGEFAAVRCTGPQELKGKCLVLFFVKTDQGWLNYSLRASMESTPLADSLAALKSKQ